MENQYLNADKLEFTQSIQENLKEIAKWAKFLAILGFVGIAILVLVSIFTIIFGVIASSMEDTPFPLALVGVLYLGMAAVYYFPIKYLYDFATNMKDSLKTSNRIVFSRAFENLKSHYKFMGIFTIVMLSLYILILIGVLLIVGFLGAIGGY
ncbi:hypothetical protein [Capnocytophaga canis]|uniref:DUF5362 domain-containing protein n=1 Tax=Capnocytophaga canis TaxID=1848903 RepID=A0A0B7INU2_9FLAO|nr:hypothetical protein [Capnocytophaga canis]CEN51672.1 conserved membrane hypothetical protein [Capnocytophaga canis]